MDNKCIATHESYTSLPVAIRERASNNEINKVVQVKSEIVLSGFQHPWALILQQYSTGNPRRHGVFR